MARSRRRRSRKPAPSSSGPTKPPTESKAPGARVARVAVDNDIWTAFRELCGSTPASIRLGQLVEADVRRATCSSNADADAALTAIRAQVDALEALLVAGGGELSPHRP